MVCAGRRLNCKAFCKGWGRLPARLLFVFFLSVREVCVRHPRMVRARCRSSHDLLNGKVDAFLFLIELRDVANPSDTGEQEGIRE